MYLCVCLCVCVNVCVHSGKLIDPCHILTVSLFNDSHDESHALYLSKFIHEE